VLNTFIFLVQMPPLQIRALHHIQPLSQHYKCCYKSVKVHTEIQACKQRGVDDKSWYRMQLSKDTKARVLPNIKGYKAHLFKRLLETLKYSYWQSHLEVVSYDLLGNNSDRKIKRYMQRSQSWKDLEVWGHSYGELAGSMDFCSQNSFVLITL